MLTDRNCADDDLARSILDASVNCVLVLNLDGRITFLNEAGARALELSSSRALDGTAWANLWPLQHRSQARAAVSGAGQGRCERFAGMCPSARGTELWWDVVVGPVKTRSGEAGRVVVIATDVTASRRAKEDAELARRNLEAVLSGSTDNILVVDRNWNVTYINDRARAKVGRGGLLEVGKNLWDAYPEQIESEFHRHYARALQTRTAVQFDGYLTALKLWVEVHAFPTEDGLAIFFHDMTEAKQGRDRIRYLAHHDALTGLPNRARFLEHLEAALANAVATAGSLAVVYVDLDDFKSVNDTLGHDAGDAVLVAAARRLRECTPASGLVSRIGGDEFALLLSEDIGFDQVEQLVLQLREALSKPVSHLGTELSCRASCGISLFPHSDPNPAELMKNADLALSEAKRSGGHQHAFFSPRVRQSIQQRVSALACARDALARDAIVPFYQPKVSFKSGRVEGFEALLRWMHPRNGVQGPGLIKEAFQDPILAVDLGHRMLDRVISDMQGWRARGLAFGSVAINVSAPEFVRTDFSGTILKRLEGAGLPTGVLEIEVTETVFLDEGADAVREALNQLHRNGIGIALDDFGTGYASLTHLNKFPVSWLKIDQSFVKALDSDPDAIAIVKAVMGLSQSLGIDVVAEGVETLDQWRMLKKARCTLGQGFLISKPMSAERVPHFLATWAGVCDDAVSDTRATRRP